MNFPEGLGGLCYTCGNSGGVGGHHFPAKMANPGWWWWGGGVLSEIPSVVGVWIFSGTTHSLYIQFCTFVRATQIVTRLQVCMPWGLLPGWWLCEKVNMDPWIYIDGNWMLWAGFHFWMERYIDPFFLSLPMLFSLFVHKIWSNV